MRSPVSTPTCHQRETRAGRTRRVMAQGHSEVHVRIFHYESLNSRRRVQVPIQRRSSTIVSDNGLPLTSTSRRSAPPAV